MSLLVFGAFVFTRSTEAQKTNILPVLLELPAPPPPNPLTANEEREHSEEFYSKKNPPAESASTEELLDYWKFQNQQYADLAYNLELSGRNLDRVLGEIEKTPDKITEYLNVLPDTPEVADFVKRIYDRRTSSSINGEDEDYLKNQIKSWLTTHSRYFSDELLNEAQNIKDTPEGYVSGQTELLALARVDWDKAKPILDRMYNDSTQPVSQTLARWAFYRRAIATDSLGDIERYRDELKTVVENKKVSDGQRDLAMDALVKEKEWNGRDDWYFSLLEDETLSDLKVGEQTYTGLTTLVMTAPPEKYNDKMLELVKTSTPSVRNAAVRNLSVLLDSKNIEVVKALLPWLENANWAKETSGERQKLVTALQNYELPESVPGLIALLDEKATRDVPDYSSGNANVMMNTNVMTSRTLSNVAVVSPGKIRSEEYFPLRSAAITALANQKNPQAVPALRRILPEAEQYERTTVIRALYLSNGFSVKEQIEALETAAQIVKTEMDLEIGLKKTRIAEDDSDSEATETLRPDSDAETTDSAVSEEYQPERNKQITAAEISLLLGQNIITNAEPSAELLTALITRINILDRTDPPIAAALRKIMLGWRGAAVNQILLNDLKNDKADINEIIKLLSIRRELRENQPNDVYALRSGGSSVALGISACLLENQSDFNALLVSENADAKAAMFGCARLIRAALPVKIVAQNFNSPNKTVALAAERYLESEDSPEARQIILAKYPNQAKILGATTYFGENREIFNDEVMTALFRSVINVQAVSPYDFFYGESENIRRKEKKLQKEILETPDLLGVYAYNNNFVRIYGDKVMFSFAEDESRYRERYLTEAEFNNLKNYLAANRVDELVPFLSYCEECAEKELLMLGRQGGRRVYMRGEQPEDFFAGLDTMFEQMRIPPAKLHYELEKNVAGLQILFADQNLQALTVWKNGGDLRVLTADTKLREQIDEDLSKQETQVKYNENTDYGQVEKANIERRRQREFEHLSWRKSVGENFNELTAAPTVFDLPTARDAFPVRAATDGWKSRAANVEIRTDETGLYKISGGTIKKIREGYYDKAVITPDGRWAVVSKYGENYGIYRINLITNKEIQINNQTPMIYPVAVMPSGRQIIVRVEDYDEYGEEPNEFVNSKGGNFLVLDVATGAIEKTKGEIRPLAQQTFRALQKASSTDEFWAAIPNKKATQVGIYNAKTLTFRTLLTIPQISFDSMNMWMDETENKVYFVYKGQLLALNMPKK